MQSINHAPNGIIESADSLIQRYESTSFGAQDRNWLSHYQQALRMYQMGEDFRRRHNSKNVGCTNWVGRQKRGKHLLDPIKQQLLERSGL